MKHFTRFLSLFLGAVMILTMAACGSKNTDTDTKTGSEKKQLVVATSPDFPPFESLDGSDIVGIEPKLMQAIATREVPLSKLAEPVQIYPQVLKNLKVKDKDAAMEDKAVLAAAEAAEKKLSGAGRVLLRKSGTEPLVRVMAEAATQEACQEAVDSIVAVIAAQGHLPEANHA